MKYLKLFENKEIEDIKDYFTWIMDELNVEIKKVNFLGNVFNKVDKEGYRISINSQNGNHRDKFRLNKIENELYSIFDHLSKKYYIYYVSLNVQYRLIDIYRRNTVESKDLEEILNIDDTDWIRKYKPSDGGLKYKTETNRIIFDREIQKMDIIIRKL